MFLRDFVSFWTPNIFIPYLTLISFRKINITGPLFCHISVIPISHVHSYLFYNIYFWSIVSHGGAAPARPIMLLLKDQHSFIWPTRHSREEFGCFAAARIFERSFIYLSVVDSDRTLHFGAWNERSSFAELCEWILLGIRGISLCLHDYCFVI